MIRRFLLCSIALLVSCTGFYAFAIKDCRHDGFTFVTISPFIRDYYESMTLIWLVERDSFNKLRQEAESQAKLNHSGGSLSPLVDRPSVPLSLGHKGAAVVYLPVRPIELVDLLPFLQTDGSILESGQMPLKILIHGKSVAFGGRDSAQLVYYLREIANQR